MTDRPALEDSARSVVVLFPDNRTGGVTKVQKLNPYAFMQFGETISGVKRLADDATLGQCFSPVHRFRNSIKRLINGDPILLQYSLGAAKDCLRACQNIMVRYYEDDSGKIDFTKDWTDHIEPYLLAGAKSSIEKLQHNLAAEFEGAATFFVPRVAAFDTSVLIAKAEEHLPDGVRDVLDADALKDFNDAGRCLGFGLHTAVGFHALRALEATLLVYFNAFLPDSKVPKMWGEIIDLLEKKAEEPKPDAGTLMLVRQIKDVDRNALMHPRKNLDFMHARRLFDIASGAITAMAIEIRELPSTEKQESFGNLLALPTQGAG